MSRNKLLTKTLLIAVLAIAFTGSTQAQNSAPNPYDTVADWAKLPAGRVWGATSAVYPANDGKNIWIAERCGENLCVGSNLDPNCVQVAICSPSCVNICKRLFPRSPTNNRPCESIASACGSLNCPWSPPVSPHCVK